MQIGGGFLLMRWRKRCDLFCRQGLMTPNGMCFLVDFQRGRQPLSKLHHTRYILGEILPSWGILFCFLIVPLLILSASVQIGPGANSAFCTMGTGSFLGVKRLGRGVNHHSCSAEVKERIELHHYFPSGPLWPVVRQTILTLSLPFILIPHLQSSPPPSALLLQSSFVMIWCQQKES